MRLGVDFNILNQKGTPAFYSDIFANRPAFGFAGRVFISTDTGAIYEDTGSAWTLIADAGAGTTGTLQQVTTNGNTTTLGITAQSFITSGGTAAQFLKGNGSLDSGTYLPITGGISTDQVLKVYSSGGNFYLGSSTISDNGTSVTINGRITSNSDTISVNGTASNIQMQINNQTATTGKQWYLNSKSTGILGIGNNTANDILNFASTGNATFLQGIRATGTADQQLWVYGGSPSLRIYDNTTSPTMAGFYGMATSANNFIQGSAFGDLCIGTSTGGKIYIGTASGTITPAITVLNSGNVGIGTSSPTNSISGTETTLQISNNNVASLSLESTGTNGHKYALGSLGGSAAGIFGIYDVTSSAYRLQITSGGNVLIGTTTDSGEKLQINGGLISKGSTSSLAFIDRANLNTMDWYSTGNITYLRNSSVGNIAQINNTTGIYTPLSDINKKKDFEQSTIGLNAILNLKPTLFRMKSEDETKDKTLGFIAQEVKEFIPQAYVESNDFIGLTDRPIIAALVKAIQELNDKIEKLNNN